MSAALTRIFIATVALSLGCSVAVAADRSDVRAEFVDPAAPAVAAILKTGEAATAQLGARLVSELTTALAKGGPEAAVEVCHLKALPLTAEKPASLPAVVSVKRISPRLRNPANAPDAAEQLALDHAAALLARGETLPPLLVQRVDAAGATAPEWRVYRSIVVQPACLACHGNPAAQSPALRAALQQRYPHDTALNYEAGQWRGFIRATIAAPSS